MDNHRRQRVRGSFLEALLGLVLAASWGAAPLWAEGLKAGVARVDITPPTGVRMWGYFDRLTPAQGVLDPLFARVLVLELGDKRLAYVDLDLGRPFGPTSLAHLRDRVRRSAGISDVLVQATHTHAGPVVMDEYPGGEPAWEVADLDRIAHAIDEAQQRAVPARLGAGYGSAYIGYNRRRVNPDGTVTMFWRNSERLPTAPVDPTVAVLRVDTTDGKPLAILVNYACHPVTFGPDNLRFSADFPGVMTETVEEAFKGTTPSPLCFFLQGAPGDINVYDATIPVKEGAVEKRDCAGRELGKEAARVARSIHTAEAPQASLDFREDLLTFHLRWDAGRLHRAFLTSSPEIFQTFAPRLQETMRLPVATVLINQRIALMTMPGEPFVDFQINWRDRCPVRDAFFLGYANGYYGYFPTVAAAAQGGYGTASATTWVEVGAGERMVDHALDRLYEMLGRLSDTPEDLK